jgi:Flp pilus assembly protein TadD
MARFLRILVLCAAGLGALGVGRAAAATAGAIAQDAVCDVAADSALGLENYPQAIKLHQRILAAHPDDALAHYHLGFAYGMVGQRDEELGEYREAAKLGLREWDLYVNLGRVYLEGGDYPAASDTLRIAVALGPNHPEAHFNLGLAYERRAMLPQAEQEMRTALRLGGDQPEASNMLAVISMEEGNQTEARRIWTELIHSRPDFTVAQTNLSILDHRVVASAPLTASTAVAYTSSQR